jgi:hypothetical protein
MVPYFTLRDVNRALFVSIAITGVILLGFGLIKNWVTVQEKSAIFGAIQTLCVCRMATAASYGIVKVINSSDLGEGGAM